MSADTTTDEALNAGESALDASERKELQNPGYEIFIAALSILSILNLVLIFAIEDEALNYVLLFMNALLSGVLFLDFCLRLWTAESKPRYLFRQFGWADLLASLPLMQLKVLRVFRLIRVYRLLKVYGVRNISRSLSSERAGSALLGLLLLAFLVLEFGSLWMLGIESTDPDANITSASDAIWYTIVTISTVGYGDQFPVTNPGRLLGAVVIILGVGIFGTLTGYLANAFIAPRKRRGPTAQAAAAVAAPIEVRFVASVSLVTSAPAADRSLLVDTLGLPLHAAKGESADGYLFSEAIAGAKHFGVWPLEQAAQTCFGTEEWPESHPVPQASIEFEVDDVAAAAQSLVNAGHTLLHPARTEPWEQVIARLQSADGVLIGVCFTPWLRER
jgi:voltage-gated potassium channel